MNISDPSIEIPGVIEYSNLNQMPPSILYAPFYMPKTHPKWARNNDQLIDEVIGYLGRLNPRSRTDWVLARHCHRYDFAQTICPPGFTTCCPPCRLQSPVCSWPTRRTTTRKIARSTKVFMSPTH